LLTISEQTTISSGLEKTQLIMARLAAFSVVGVVEEWDGSLDVLGEALKSADESVVQSVIEKYKKKKSNVSTVKGQMGTKQYVEMVKKNPELYERLRHFLRFEEMIWEKGKEVLERKKVEFGVA